MAAVVASLLLTGSVVLAQTGDEPAPAPAPETPPPDVTVTGAKRAEISPSAMNEQAGQLRGKMTTSLGKIVQLQETARRAKDVIKLNCVNDKLLQMKQLMNIAETASTNLQEAIARSDDDGRYHEFARITIAQQEVAVLAGEAENCIGEPDVSYLGATEVIVEDAGTFIDFTPPFDVEIVEPLPVASPRD
jgi:hypothetical protein